MLLPSLSADWNITNDRPPLHPSCIGAKGDRYKSTATQFASFTSRSRPCRQTCPCRRNPRHCNFSELPANLRNDNLGFLPDVFGTFHSTTRDCSPCTCVTCTLQCRSQSESCMFQTLKLPAPAT